MIVVNDVHKRYRTRHGVGDWILRGVSFTIPRNTNVGLVGANGVGKSTLLRIIGGIDYPSKGTVERHCRVSWPMGQGGLEGTLTGRQNAKFVCRVHGHEHDLAEKLAYIQDFSGLGKAFDEPVYTYSTGMRSRLQFGLSLAFEFDVYISDEVTAAGDAAFRRKTADAFKAMVDRTGLIMVTHNEGELRQFCRSGLLIHQGKTHWFDAIDDALSAYKDTLPK